MALYKVTLWNGCEGLLAARSGRQAVNIALADHGAENVRRVERAKPEHADWIVAMGGRVPDDPYRRAVAAP